MVEIRALDLQSKMNSNHTHSSKNWAFFQKREHLQEVFGGFVYPKAVWLM